MAGPIRGMQKLTDEDVNRAADLLAQGLSPDAVRDRLIEGGLTPGLASSAIEQVAQREVYNEAFGMLSQGRNPDAVKAFLMQKGMTPFLADEVIQEQMILIQSMKPGPGAARRVIGGCVVALGIGLWIGNMTGVFPTFPFAGIIVIFIGCAIMGS